MISRMKKISLMKRTRKNKKGLYEEERLPHGIVGAFLGICNTNLVPGKTNQMCE